MSYVIWLDHIQNNTLEVPRKSNRTDDNYHNHNVHRNRQIEFEPTSSGLTIPPISSRPDQKRVIT